MANSNSTTAERITFKTPEGRVKVVRHGSKDFGLYLDGLYAQSYEYSFLAEQQRRLHMERAGAPGALPAVGVAEVARPAPDGDASDAAHRPSVAMAPPLTSAPYASQGTQALSALPSFAPVEPHAVLEANATPGDGSWMTDVGADASADAMEPPDAGAVAQDAEEALTGLDDLPIRFRSAADVGTGAWAAIFERHPGRRSGSGDA